MSGTAPAVSSEPATSKEVLTRDGWRAHLALDYRFESGRTVGRCRHEGPLRVLKPLYPEGNAVCHHVVVHPPGGIVGGDELQLDVTVGAGAHALVTTPGAARFYRSAGPQGVQRATLTVAEGARLEWLPLETIAYPGCEALNETRFVLEPGAEMIGWDLLALGLPAASAAFDAGRYRHRVVWPGRWLDEGLVAAHDRLLLDGPLGFAGHRALLTMWWAGRPGDASNPAALAEPLLEGARAALATAGAALRGGATASHPGLVVVRALAARIEPLFRLASQVRAGWREARWGLAEGAPRVWRT